MATVRGGGRKLASDLSPFKTCQWIEGEPRDRDFCGDPTQAGSSYCPAHHRRCYSGKAPAVVE